MIDDAARVTPPQAPPPPPPPPPPATPTPPTPQIFEHPAWAYAPGQQHAPYAVSVQPPLVLDASVAVTAGVGLRFSARLIDWMLLSVLTIVVKAIATSTVSIAFDWQTYRAVVGTLTILLAVMSYLYFIVCESAFGATIGNRVLNQRVVNRGGGNPTGGQAFKRNVFMLPYYLGTIASGIVILTGHGFLLGTLSSFIYGGFANIVGYLASTVLAIFILVTISNSPTGRGSHDVASDSAVVTRR